MGKYNIYKCKLDVLPTELSRIIEKYRIDYNTANKNGIKMGELAERIYCESKSNWAFLPFCHTIEGQAFGSKVEIDHINGNRIVEYSIDKLEDIDKILISSLDKEVVEIVLDAIRYLKNKKLPVAVNVVGPTTLATSILPTDQVYRGMAKKTESMKRLFSIVEDFLINYINEILALDIDLLSYADPTGTLDIIGAKLYKEIAGPSYLRILENINLQNNTIIHICPKSSTSLLAVDMIEENPSGFFWGGNCISKTDGIQKSRKYMVK